jgi:hypothetical protein
VAAIESCWPDWLGAVLVSALLVLIVAVVFDVMMATGYLYTTA